LVAMAMSLELSQSKSMLNEDLHTPTNPENLVKIGSVDSEITQ